MEGNYAGVDWAAEKHDVIVEDAAGKQLLAASLAHDEDGQRSSCRTLVRMKVALVAIERPDGLLVKRLLDAWLRLLALHPNQAAVLNGLASKWGPLVRHQHDKPISHAEDEMKYVLTFRGQVGRRLTADEEGRWPTWFEQIKDSIADFGNRVGQVREVGGGRVRPDELSGYIVINADSLDGAAAVAGGCPILQQGGSVEVGEIIDA